MDLTHRTAYKDSDWNLFYDEFKRYYKPDKFGWFNSSDADWNELNRREKDLENWKLTLASKGIKIVEPKRVAEETLSDSVKSITTYVVIGAASLAAIYFISKNNAK